MIGENHDSNPLQKLLDFLDDLDDRKIHYTLARHREAVMVCVNVPGERWEVEFFADGGVEVEIFRATESGVVGRPEADDALRRLLTDFAD